MVAATLAKDKVSILVLMDVAPEYYVGTAGTVSAETIVSILVLMDVAPEFPIHSQIYSISSMFQSLF